MAFGSLPGIYRDQPAFLGMVGRGEDLHLLEPRGFEAGRHAFGRQRAASVRQRGVGLDQLLVDLAELRLAGTRFRVAAATAEVIDQCAKGGGRRER